MTVQEVIDALGLDAETAAIVTAKVKAEKAASLKSQTELDALNARATALESELVADGKKGARNYKQWYEENFPKIQKLQGDYAKYVERYGAIDPANPNPANPNPNPTAGPSLADVQKLIQETYTPQWSSLLKGSGKIIEKHLRSGRKNELDWDKLAEIATTKNGDLTAAYDEWDRPEREKADTVAREAEIEKRVKAEMAKRNTQTFFPSTEQTSSGISPLSKDRGNDSKYDRSKVLESALTGIYEPTTVQ